MKTHLKPTLGFAHNGDPVVLIELGNRPGVCAIMDPADYKAWIAAGRSAKFFAYQGGYVGFHDPARPHSTSSVARAMLAAKDGRVVRFGNGDGFDLRRRNLHLVGGASGPRRRQLRMSAQPTPASEPPLPWVGALSATSAR